MKKESILKKNLFRSFKRHRQQNWRAEKMPVVAVVLLKYTLKKCQHRYLFSRLVSTSTTFLTFCIIFSFRDPFELLAHFCRLSFLTSFPVYHPGVKQDILSKIGKNCRGNQDILLRASIPLWLGVSILKYILAVF